MLVNWLDKNGNARVYVRVMDDVGGKRMVRDLTDTPAKVAAELRLLADQIEGK